MKALELPGPGFEPTAIAARVRWMRLGFFPSATAALTRRAVELKLVLAALFRGELDPSARQSLVCNTCRRVPARPADETPGERSHNLSTCR